MKRVKLAFLSLKLKRPCKNAILRTKGEATYFVSYKVIVFEMRINEVITTKGDLILTSFQFSLIMKKVLV